MTNKKGKIKQNKKHRFLKRIKKIILEKTIKIIKQIIKIIKQQVKIIVVFSI